MGLKRYAQMLVWYSVIIPLFTILWIPNVIHDMVWAFVLSTKSYFKWLWDEMIMGITW